MQLAVPPPEVLLPLGAGVAVSVVAVIVLLLVRRARRRRTAQAPGASPTPAAPAQPTEPGRPWETAAERVGSGRTVAAAVAQALAVREAHAGTAAPTPSGARADARDRLLAVLLDDPVRAVGAVVELESCRRQLDRLTDAVRHERATLADVLGRLSCAGLAPDQLARLSGLSDDELRSLMQQRAQAR